jgi:hypothetical protein
MQLSRKRCFILLTIFISLVLPASASIIKKPPVKSTELSYDDLVCTEEHKIYIREIITTMAENGKLALLFKQTHLKEIGAKINDVHPLKFLSTVFSDPDLKTCMFPIWSDYFKRTNLIDGLGASLTREAEKGKLHQHLERFAEDVGVPAADLQPYFDQRDWENMVFHLMHS